MILNSQVLIWQSILYPKISFDNPSES
jgi:hypothetical protein